ncbi:lysozyme [Rickettsia endosymbiont of Cardiosporidium cionae]|uniref:lysozyme n=1 Tax=Rickettsia endosymbiont of Cardiosporidium cionae TaxID=2777155 RepID=UPI0018932B14|nr:lysozyme [Rickettsia endosymbiont of Cardiosporidium cionae]KAF8818424.1 lysozyme [Rickettsia endosymbiont of Cardiosporidium cionae]
MSKQFTEKRYTHRSISKNAINMIKNFEGFSSTPYVCAGGHFTIGYGHKILENEKYQNINKNLAQKILIKDISKAENAVIRYIEVNLTNNQFEALVSFTFNLGNAALQRSTLRQKLNYELYYEASLEFLKWIYVKGKQNLGLIHRRKIERKLFITN